ncbi:putative rRNA maturation factor [Bacillus thermophilus]|uniref:Endoribonuclease YbeY n=1 Tax=Siminovitchia thermophila TaxID=1245522 RepID=A0ABS2RAB2_9BACI|nr:rRNA maturation RNase YbeY [Siminovitchia thermophila]MBM7716300.1 putative rRNA maturation factor [Siminovitchia thermophila]ONK24208.1 rRNA maturation RNase YbeY [Bacillus sp. VT-16-64]
MELEIDFIEETNEVQTSQLELVERLLKHAASLEMSEKDDGEVSVIFVSNEAIRELNHSYRGKNEPTDVLSFPMEELGEGEMEIAYAHGTPRMLGDIVISIDKAREQAHEYGHSLERELGFLAVHGFLHLLGYDHMTPEEEQKMFQKQEEILKSYGLER